MALGEIKIPNPGSFDLHSSLFHSQFPVVACSVVVSMLWTPPPERHRQSSHVILVESRKIDGHKVGVARGFYVPLSSFRKFSDGTRRVPRL
ncbi:hypothetical protein V6N13_030647 [Hibiscus sabdariffa]|uniref:Uncharacterized protein n=1 Tax=Hibiscus sabdariffa TaxID=183260 RepID=A0ABR2D5U2_9ROSI